jgi:hypothetical protein
MNHGIFRHGLLKTFLTRSFLGSIFRPILYTKSDNIHSDFVDPLNHFAIKLNQASNLEYRMLLGYWLVLVPKTFFEILFVEDEQGGVYFDVLNKATGIYGKECAYITQAFTLWYLHQFLKNDPNFKAQIGLSMDDVETVIKNISGNENQVLQYLNYFRYHFTDESEVIDPADWPVNYYAIICKTLIRDSKVLKGCLVRWDKKPLDQVAFATLTSKFFGEQKGQSLALKQ